ncbi:MAG TPA: TldD/PmbA family protein [Terriglobia bacterium]|jgi:TldD protein|nr:TldD/PmbA family protein [Terriglobia bacterium]
MKEHGVLALDAVTSQGAVYADVRVMDIRQRYLSTKNGETAQVRESESFGLGVRVIVNGAWGFAATDDLSRQGVLGAAMKAIEIAKASALVKKKDVQLAPERKIVDHWEAPCRIDPFSVPVSSCIDLMLKVDAELRKVRNITLSEVALDFHHIDQLFLSSLGSEIRQVKTQTGAGFVATSFAGNEIQRRSYPNSFGGQYQTKGYELVEELDLLGNAPRIAEEAAALHACDQCPVGEADVILGSSQLGLQIHESIGHPIELDRVLGAEANFAGMSFLTLDKLGTLKYASDIVNVVADATPAHGPGLGTFAYDDEGVAAQNTPIIKDGLFTGYLTSRETAAEIGQERSNGSMRAEGWNRIPLIRMTNVSLLPGKGRLEDLIADTDDGIYMETNRSWSIDDRRYNFQFGTEIGWEIKHGKRTRMLKNPSYGGITTEFWNSCDAICGPEEWTLWGTPNCGKGQPMQTMGTGHGASPARFRKVRVGMAYSR